MLMENTCNNKDEEHEESVDLPSLHPVIVGSPETSVTFDSDSITSDEFSEQLAVPNQILSPGSAVHIEKSTDVVIGPLTQFHGPVTIYQNINSDKAIEGTKEKTIGKSENIEKQRQNNCGVTPSRCETLITKIPSKRLLVATGIIILAALIFVITITVLTTISSNTDENSSTYPPFVGNYRMYDRSEWGGRPALNFTRPLNHPVEYVIISHTVYPFCSDFFACSKIMQKIQAQHVAELNSPDVGYNFVIGGDAGIYIGRGWDIRNFHQDRNIGISFNGDFRSDYLTPDMIEALKELLDLGTTLGKLSKNFKLVAHNQTFPTISPGEHAYIEISKMDHFYDGVVNI